MNRRFLTGARLPWCAGLNDKPGAWDEATGSIYVTYNYGPEGVSGMSVNGRQVPVSSFVSTKGWSRPRTAYEVEATRIARTPI